MTSIRTSTTRRFRSSQLADEPRRRRVPSLRMGIGPDSAEQAARHGRSGGLAHGSCIRAPPWGDAGAGAPPTDPGRGGRARGCRAARVGRDQRSCRRGRVRRARRVRPRRPAADIDRSPAPPAVPGPLRLVRVLTGRGPARLPLHRQRTRLGRTGGLGRGPERGDVGPRVVRVVGGDSAGAVVPRVPAARARRSRVTAELDRSAHPELRCAGAGRSGHGGVRRTRNGRGLRGCAAGAHRGRPLARGRSPVGCRVGRAARGSGRGVGDLRRAHQLAGCDHPVGRRWGRPRGHHGRGDRWGAPDGTRSAVGS